MLNQRIKELRTGLSISQVELSKKLGVSKQCISNWENDNIQPSIDMLVKLSKFFGVSTDYLLGIDDKKTLDVSMLSDEEAAHIKLIISDIAKNWPKIYYTHWFNINLRISFYNISKNQYKLPINYAECLYI